MSDIDKTIKYDAVVKPVNSDAFLSVKSTTLLTDVNAVSIVAHGVFLAKTPDDKKPVTFRVRLSAIIPIDDVETEPAISALTCPYELTYDQTQAVTDTLLGAMKTYALGLYKTACC